jgi:hypothetical protein
MPEYREVRRPSQLSTRALTDAESEILNGGAAAAIGLGLESPSQLEIAYTSDRTLVRPVNAPSDLPSFSFAGHVSPFDARAWVLARLGK